MLSLSRQRFSIWSILLSLYSFLSGFLNFWIGFRIIRSETVSRFCVQILLVWVFIMGSASLASAFSPVPFSNRYDDSIQKHVKRYWPDYPDWYYWKAQLYQESQLNPEAKSGVGAEGLAQFMPATWEDVLRQLGRDEHANRQVADLSIEAGAYYMEKLRLGWSPENRSSDDRHRLAQASYNAGMGSLIKAQRLCNGARDYSAIVLCLPRVTGKLNAKQTTDYVTRIAYWRSLMKPQE